MGAGAFKAAVLALACAACTSIAVDERTFEGTSWRVTAINGHATPKSEAFRMSFAHGRFTARLGCNLAQGIYRIEGAQVIPGFAGHTEMACYETTPGAVPLMTFEDWGFKVLHRPMRMDWSSGRTLTLSNDAGSIALERLP